MDIDVSALTTDAHALVKSVGASSVSNYCSIMSAWRSGCDVGQNLEFQRRYSHFYRMNRYVTPEFKRWYFRRLESLRHVAQPEVDVLVWEYFKIAAAQDRKLQYSFVTKMAHTANVNYPIYDSLVANLFGFRPSVSPDPEARLSQLSAFYQQLSRTCLLLRQDSEMRPLITLFREVYDVEAASVSDVKAIDFLFWTAGRQGLRLVPAQSRGRE